MIITTDVKTKCDVRDCKNPAECYFEIKGRAGSKLFLCKQCLEKLTGDVFKRKVPKSPQNAIKRKMEQKREEQYYGEN